jgi:hypothetical protein
MLRAFAVCCVLILLPRSAAAEWQFTPMIGATFFGSTNLIDHEFATDNVHRNFGGSVSLLGGGLLGVESVFVWTPGFFDDPTAAFQLVESSRSISWMGNIVLTAPRRWTEYGLRPFVSGGVGWLHARTIEQAALIPFDANLLGFNVGGGAIGFFTERTGIRFDLRYHSNLKPTADVPGFGENRLRYLTASVGLVLRRGFR